jgi:putative ABC transport system permease protein
MVVRSLARQKGWTIVAVLTLALGIGANSALFTIINAVMLRPLPFRDPDRILSISESDKGVDRQVVPAPTIVAWRQSARSIESLAAYSSARTIINGTDASETVSGIRATPNYFAVLGVAPSRGRVFTADDARAGAPKVAVLSDQLWRRAFGADPAILGKKVSFDGTPTTVIGIMPPSFTNERRAQYWIPLDMTPRSGAIFFYQVVGRLRPGASIEGARTELAGIEQRLDDAAGVDKRGLQPVVMTFHARRYGDTRMPLLILLGAVGVLLLIACTNVANLLLARAARRQREYAVRVALGASRWRVIRYLLCESLVIALLGAALGLVIPLAATGYLVRTGPETLALVDHIGIDWVVLSFTFVVAVATGVLFGLAPALHAGRADVSQTLSGGSRSTTTRRQNRIRGALVVAELSTALVLLTGAGILTKSFARVTSIDSGIRSEHVLVVSFSLSRTRYPDAIAGQFFAPLVERAAKIPGVRSIAMADATPLSGVRMSFSTTNAVTHTSSPKIDEAVVGEGYFETLGIQLRSGRLFSPSEHRDGQPKTAVVNEAFVRALFPGQDPLGKLTSVGGSDSARVVGVVHDVLQHGIESAAPPMVYLPMTPGGIDGFVTILINATGDPAGLVTSVRQIARSIDATQPVPKFTTMEDIVSTAVAPRRFSFTLLGLLAVLAATLAAIGLYGVMAYLVAERTNEIGIRMALGADRARVLRLVVGEGTRLIVVGIVFGLAASAAAVRLLRGLVFEVSVYDPWAFAAGAALLGGVALIACYVPARRATRVDPMIALRGE